MKTNLRRALALVVVGILFAAAPLGAAPPVDPRTLTFPPLTYDIPVPERFVLDNGMTVLLMTDRALPLIQTTAIPLVVVGSNKFAPTHFAEVVAMARQKPETLTMGNSGIGTAAHIGMELLNSVAGVKFVHVPYKGIPPALTDLISGDLQMLCTSPAQVMGPIREGKIKALAIAGAARWAKLPGVPTVQEAGIPGFEASVWYALLAPAGTKPDHSTT